MTPAKLTAFIKKNIDNIDELERLSNVPAKTIHHMIRGTKYRSGKIHVEKILTGLKTLADLKTHQAQIIIKFLK